MPLNFCKKIDLRIYAALLSILLCLIAYSKNDPINYDGILYLATAAAYLKTGLVGAMQLYDWPFYAILIAWLGKLTRLSLLYAAYILNNFFLIIIITTFITLLKELGGSQRLQIIGAAVILIYPQLNDYRDYIVRDFAYWAFFLLAFWQLLRFSRTLHWSNAIAWNISIILATLFRIEGVILVIFAPLILLFLPHHSVSTRLKLTLQAYSFVIFAMVAAALYSLKHPTFINHLGRIPEVMQQLANGWRMIGNNFHEKVKLAGLSLLSPYSMAHASAFMACGLIGLFLALVITTLSPLYCFLAGYGMMYGVFKLTKTNQYILYYLLALNLLIPAVFFAQQFFLSERYLMAFCLLLLLWLPAALEQLLLVWQNKWLGWQGQRWLFPLIILILVAMAAGAIFKYGHSKAYITQAGHWLNKNTPVNSSVYSNNKQILFYAARTPIDFAANYFVRYDDSKPLQTIKDRSWKNYDYLALRITQSSHTDEAQILQLIGRTPSQIFRNKRGDEVLIFKLK